jgi:Ca2+/H+ antiporter, TMEM165/GDT1 family
MSLAVLGTVFPVIFISELPDKTMFASLVLATRGRAFAVWCGAAAAFAVHVCIAVTIGAALFTWLPQRVVQAVAAALFLGGAALAFRGSVATPSGGKMTDGTSGAGQSDPDGPGGAESVAVGLAAEPATAPAPAEAAPARASGDAANSAGPAGDARITTNPAAPAALQDSAGRVFLTTFVVVFLAEWGDLTQILTASLAARFHAPLAVGLGAGLALWSVTALAVVASRLLRRLPVALVRRLTGIVLLVLAAFAAVAAATGS